MLIAILTALACGLNQNKIFKTISRIKPVPGRLECVANLKNNSSIIVDFSHTPDALEKSLVALKKQFKKEIVIVFGCGGERDKEKRISMGKIVKKVTDFKKLNNTDNTKEFIHEIDKSYVKSYTHRNAISYDLLIELNILDKLYKKNKHTIDDENYTLLMNIRKDISVLFDKPSYPSFYTWQAFFELLGILQKY